MKKTQIPAFAVLLLSLLIAVGSQTFLGACVHEDGSFGTCHWAARAVLALGAVQAVMALMALVMPQQRQGLYMGLLPVSVAGLLTPGTLIDICKMNTMRCRMLMRPAMLVLFALTLAVALAGCLAVRGNKV
ncbi:MAG: DUF4418 family protein [Clostridia bacterium]|nr:DUF4418 family protein [Clostridia bacterium]